MKFQTGLMPEAKQLNVGQIDGYRDALSKRSSRLVITISILGGLGNQMFQYAAAESLAVRHGVELGIDDRSFRSYLLRSFLLDRLQIPEADSAIGRRAPSEPAPPANFAAMQWRNRADRLLARLGLT